MRVSIPDEVAAEVLFRHHRICWVCNIPGKTVQIHHIDDDHANNDPANLAVLCLECHNETQVTGGFGRKLRAPEVIKHRNDWVQRVKERKAEVDRILVARMAAVTVVDTASNDPWQAPSEKGLLALINSLPDTLRYVYEQARPDWDSGVRPLMMGGTSLVIDVLEQTWVRLAAWYPPNHFGDKPADRYIGEYIMQRHIWNAALGEPDGRGTAGREAAIISAGETMLDAENAIAETVRWLASSRLDNFDFDAWHIRWKAATE